MSEFKDSPNPEEQKNHNPITVDQVLDLSLDSNEGKQVSLKGIVDEFINNPEYSQYPYHSDYYGMDVSHKAIGSRDLLPGDKTAFDIEAQVDVDAIKKILFNRSIEFHYRPGLFSVLIENLDDGIAVTEFSTKYSGGITNLERPAEKSTIQFSDNLQEAQLHVADLLDRLRLDVAEPSQR